MTVDIWLDIGSRITAERPINLDDPASKRSDMRASRDAAHDAAETDQMIAPAASNWPLIDETRVPIGIRVDQKLENTTQIAARLVALAAERGVTPVILSTIGHSGFERFGFRVEHVLGENAAEMIACEMQLMRFWNIAVVIDAEQIQSLN